MTNQELINSQLEKAKSLTQEDLQKMIEGRKTNGSNPIVKFNSGRIVKEGDIMLFGLIVLAVESQEENIELNLKFISFHPDEYESVYIDDKEFTKKMESSEFSDKYLPYLKIK